MGRISKSVNFFLFSSVCFFLGVMGLYKGESVDGKGKEGSSERGRWKGKREREGRQGTEGGN